MSQKILIVEDDQDLGPLLKQYLELNGFLVELRTNGKLARLALQISTFDIILTDVMMPVEDGFTFAMEIAKTHPEIPFLFITARKLKSDIIRGLDIGADDYIIKPFDADELVLRIRNILKRTNNHVPETTSYKLGTYILVPKEFLLIGPSERKKLTERECQLLTLLLTNLGKLVRKEDILSQLWKESDFFTARSMDVFVSRLRKYLAEDPAIQIESIRSAGLRMLIHRQ